MGILLTNQYQGFRDKHSSSDLLSRESWIVNSCGSVLDPFHSIWLGTSVNTKYGANKYPCLPMIRVFDTKVVCLTRYSGCSFPLGSNAIHHIVVDKPRRLWTWTKQQCLDWLKSPNTQCSSAYMIPNIYILLPNIYRPPNLGHMGHIWWVHPYMLGHNLIYVWGIYLGILCWVTW